MGEIKITTYDRLLRAWENSKELTRDYEVYSKDIPEEKIKNVFKQMAEKEGMNASQFRQLLEEYSNERVHSEYPESEAF
jgi:rubrerythrin